MRALTWDQRIAQLLTWLIAYLLLLAIRGWFERWLLARFHNRRGRVPLIPPLAWSPYSTLDVLLAIGNVLAGALVPLAPPLQVGAWTFAPNPFSRADAGALYVLASAWTSMMLLAAVDRPGLSIQHRILGNACKALLAGLPTLLIVLSLVVTSGAISPIGEGTLHLDTLIALQDTWAGTRWFAVLQPLAFALWLACVPIPLAFGRTRAHNTLAGQALSLNLALLTSVRSSIRRSRRRSMMRPTSRSMRETMPAYDARGCSWRP